MPNEPKQNATTPPTLSAQFELTEPEDGVFSCYANYAHVSWTGSDVMIKFCQIMQPNLELEPDAKNEVEERADVTMSWSQVKILNNMLTDIVARYEKVRGEISITFPGI